MYHCLFEQSGTFKNEFIKLGGAARDYDICNDYGQTDVVCDLFDCIDRAYLGIYDDVFSKIKPSDMIIAFFPCTRFECQVQMLFNGVANQQKTMSDLNKLKYDLYLHKQLHENYERITKLAIWCIEHNIPLIIENPMTEPHYLTKYWGIKAKVKDKDRTENGDYMKKPTQFWFIGCEPKNNLIFEPLDLVEIRNCKHMKGADRQKKRSEIHPQYANRFIRQHIADYKDGEWIV